MIKSVSDDLLPLTAELRSFAVRRNEIAHGLVGGRNECFFLNPSGHNPRKNPITIPRRTAFYAATYHYTADDIDHYRRGFEEVADKISAYTTRVLIVVGHDRSREEEHRAEDERHRPPRK